MSRYALERLQLSPAADTVATLTTAYSAHQSTAVDKRLNDNTARGRFWSPPTSGAIHLDGTTFYCCTPAEGE
jgi:hypothetical protein